MTWKSKEMSGDFGKYILHVLAKEALSIRQERVGTMQISPNRLIIWYIE